MKKLEKFIKKAIKDNTEISMPTQKQLEMIYKLSFNKKFYWSLFIELYLNFESWDYIEYEYFEKVLKEKGKDELLYSFAMDFFTLSDYTIAIKVFQKYLKKYPNHFHANYNIAQSYKQEGEKDKAIEYYQKSLKLDISHTPSYIAIANIYKNSRDYDKALEYYNIALNLTLSTPQRYDIILKTGDIYRDIQKRKKAIIYYKKAIKINNKRDDKPRNYYLYLKSAHLSKNRKKSIKYYKKAIEVRPDRYESYYSLGTSYVHKKNKKAIKLLKKSLELNSTNAQAYVNMGVSYENLDRDKKALKLYAKALKLDSSVFQSYINMFSLYEKKHQYLPKNIETMFIEKFQNNKDVYVMYIVMMYLVDIYHGKEIDLTIFEKEYKNAGMKCCSFEAKKVLKDTRKKDKKRVAELLEVLKKHTEIIN